MTKKWVPVVPAFGRNINALLPAWDEIPKEFQDDRSRWNKVASDWFFCGLRNAMWKPKVGIDTREALAHVSEIMASWEPKHEHKEAGCAYLLSEFFEDVKYDK